MSVWCVQKDSHYGTILMHTFNLHILSAHLESVNTIDVSINIQMYTVHL